MIGILWFILKRIHETSEGRILDISMNIVHLGINYIQVVALSYHPFKWYITSSVLNDSSHENIKYVFSTSESSF